MQNVETTTKQYNKIKRAVKALNDIRKEIQLEYPDYEIQWYVENDGNLHLMEGSSHSHESPNYDKVIETFYIDSCDVGAW